MKAVERVSVKETYFRFKPSLNALTERRATDLIVIHHTGADVDATAEDIHGWHLNAGYAGIGYHYVIRKKGEIERGRPIWAVGAHAYGENYHSIGIQLSGNFNSAIPTPAQIESAAMLIANLCADYDIPIDRRHVVGHSELNATDCPGRNLYARLEEIVGKANFYRYAEMTPDAVVVDVQKI